LNGDGRDAQQLLPDRRRKLEFNFEVHPADPRESNAERLLFALEISGLRVSRGSVATSQRPTSEGRFVPEAARRVRAHQPLGGSSKTNDLAAVRARLPLEGLSASDRGDSIV